MGMMTTLKINAEFEALIPALKAEELQALEASILEEGIRDAIVIWDGVIVDGHNRYRIAQRHGLDFDVRVMHFDNATDAKIWMIQNQLGRRNLPEPLRLRLVKQYAGIVKLQAEQRSLANLKNAERRISDTRGRSDKILASMGDVGKDKWRQADYVIDNAPEPLQRAWDNEEASTNHVYELTRIISKLPEQFRAKASELCIGSIDKAERLFKLYQSAGSPTTNGTFEEIMTNGGFHYGDDMDEWCDYKQASFADIQRALNSVAEHHRVISGQAKPEPKPHVSHNSGNNEWYTPKDILDKARRVLGDIDLDVASSDNANRRVRATTYYTAQNDGLQHEWTGRVWMNPPYAQPLINEFCEKFIRHWQFGNITAGLVLVNNATETAWFQTLATSATMICFPSRRIRFVSDTGELGQPLQGQAILYFGEQSYTFQKQFSDVGFICEVNHA